MMHYSIRFSYQLTLLPIAFIAVVGCGGGGGGSSKPPAAFTPTDVVATARWCSETLAPLNAIPDNSNKLAREDEINAAISKAKAISDQFIGQKISWKTDCSVAEIAVTLGNGFAADGKPLLVNYKDNPVAMMLLEERPDKRVSSDNPRYWFFQLDIPEQISIAEAKLLAEDVIVHATIKEIEIARYEDREKDKGSQRYEDEWYLMYVYLTDIKLEPAK